MWTRKATLLTGVGIVALAVGVIARSPGALGAGVVSLAFVLVNRILFRDSAIVTAERKLDLFRVFEGDTTLVDLTLTNPGKRLVFLEIRDKLPRQLKMAPGGSSYEFVALPRQASTKIHYEIHAPLLGVYEVGPTDLRIEDPFGLFFEERSVAAPDTLWVLPRIEDLRKAALISKLPIPLLGDHQVNRPGDGFDFFSLRDYAPGDTMRRINWKASAPGKMLVNQMERTTAAEVTLFIDGRAILNIGAEETSPRVLGARTAVSFIDFLYKSKDSARVIIYSDHVREIEPQPAERMIPFISQQMAELQPKGEYPLVEAVRQVLPSLRPNTPVILISPLLLDDSTIIEAASILLSNGMILVVIVPEIQALEGIDASFARALLTERATAIRELQSFGATVIELDIDASLGGAVEKARMVAS